MQAGATTIKLMADIADIQRKFAEVGKIANQTAGVVGRAFDSLGFKIGAALSVGGLAAWVKSAINAADEMSKLAQKAGVAVKDVAGLQLAFRQSGVAAEQMVPIMAKLGVAVASGNDALKAMGIASRNADGSLKSTRQVLGDVATAFAGYQDGAAKTALAVKLFGEEGAKLMPLLNGGAQALDQFDAMALKLGLTLDEQTAKQAERFNDTLDLMGQGMAGVGRQVAADLLPTLSGLANQFFTSMTEGDRLRQVSQFLGNVLKGLYVVALGVVEVFNSVGKTLGGVAAIVVNVLQGNFSMAGDIARQLKDDLTGGWRDTLAQMEHAWNATGSASFEAMAATNAQLRAQAPLIEDTTKALKEKEKAEREALKATIEAAKYANAQWDEEFKRIEDQREATEKRIRDGREMLEQIQFETRLLGMNNTEREVAVAMRELERQGVVEGTEAYKAYAQAIRDAIANRESVKAAQELRRAELDEWQKHWDQVSQSFVDALMQGGKSVAEYLKSLFRTLILRPILAPIGSAFATAFGGSASAADLVGGGATGGTFNILSAAKSAYDAISTGFASLGNSVAFAAQDIGAWLVNNTTGILNQAGGTLMQYANTLGTAASYLGGITAGLGLGSMISGQYAAFGNANISNVAGTAIGAIFGGPIGAAIGGAIGGLFNRAFGRGPVQTTGTGITGTFSTEGANVRNYQEWFQKGGWFRSNRSGVNYSAVSTELDQFLDASLQQVTAATKMYAGILGLNANAVNGITQSIRISLMGLSAEQQQQAVMNALTAFANRLAQAYANPFIRAGESAGEALARLANSLVSVNQVFDTLNQTLLQSTMVGGDAASALLDTFGGAEAFVQGTTAYYQAYYTDVERAAKATEQLAGVMASMGLTLPRTRAEFRALVESQNLYTESGRQTYAALIRLAPAFDEIQKAAEAFTENFSAAIEGLFGTLYSAIAGARTSVADARANIIGGPGVMSAAQIRAGITAASIGTPDASGVINTRNALNAAYAATDLAQQARDAAVGSVSSAQNGVTGATQNRNDTINYLKGVVQQFYALAGRYYTYVNATYTGSYQPSNTAYQYNESTNRLGSYGATSWPSTWWRDAFYADPEYSRLVGILSSGNTTLANADRTLATAQSALATANSNLANATTNLQTRQAEQAAAEAAAVAAQEAYSQALRDYVIDATAAVDKLKDLRDETLKYYEAQAELASAMLGSAANLRAAVAATRSAQLSASDNLAMRQRDFAMAYSMALATTGTTQAGYADRMAAALPGLSESLRATAATRADWVRATARLYAQSNAVAASLEANAPADYQAESLAMLNQIDGTLAAIENAAGSAEKLITDAIYATGNRNIDGLRAVIAAIRGESVPAFAAGGWHAGGLRLVGENGPELEATGPSRIYNANQTMAMLGGGGAVADEIRALREEVSMLRAEARATATNTGKTKRILERVTRDGEAMQTVSAA